ncbi:ADP-ribosylglycohydrolase family protein [Listeria rustica]|uniref:ADP-ribosylglycohydrolase family protein n=1 Tax=Listeria rustica TaxID=2713503 RepID=A0A7W1T5G7_9LIST|nr:ADP-ribosylglycohydrolase family protein [Listeria rustica]MBA3925767.1 ADP-ribosylglycohydrolase family protein [Listeria rustica]
MKDKLRAAIFGLAIGDALGVPVEFKNRGTFRVTEMLGFGVHSQPRGTWSDDTSLTIATCDSIKRCGSIDVHDMYTRFQNWIFDGQYTVDGIVFDYGITTYAAIKQGYGENAERSNGNGSLMRILPVAFVDASRADIEKISAITHAHDTSTYGCVLYVDIARKLIKGDALQEIISAIRFETPYERLAYIQTLDETEIQSTGYVVHTLEAAIWSLLHTNNYRDAVLKAVNLGKDTDTVAAVTGGLAGIIYGWEGIPREWIEALRGKEKIERTLF